MDLKKIIGVVLLAAGILALVYRGFNYTKEKHEAELGPITLEYKEKDRVEIPVWLGVALAVSGGALLVIGKK
ncbi:MAG TPA: hypothetical protein VGK94_01560 [Candidatus Polarisedimenticolia bacterium]|jgi:drug/metabolite transporter (DMT)-like permease